MRITPVVAVVTFVKLVLLLLLLSPPASSRMASSTTAITSFLSSLYAKSPRQVFSVSLAGGGVQALQWLFSTPGASRCLMEGNIPYARASMERFLNLQDGAAASSTFSSIESASLMASTARNRAAQALLEDTKDLRILQDCDIFGVACSAALVSTQPKKGLHRCHVAVSREETTKVYSLVLEKGLRSREAEDALCSRLLIDAIRSTTAGESSNSDEPTSFAFAKEVMSASEEVLCSGRDSHALQIDDVLERVCLRQSGHALFVLKNSGLGAGSKQELPTKSPSVSQLAYLEDVKLPRDTLVFPGSFNPLHPGHVELVVAALKHGQYSAPEGVPHCPVVFEIAAVNVDKPPVPKEELLSRIQSLLSSPLLQTAGVTNVAVSITSEPLFVNKSRLFKECVFVIGADTMSRLISPKYYQSPVSVGTTGLSEEQRNTLASHSMVAALATIAERGCRFIVGGRILQGASAPASSTPTSTSTSTPVAFETLDKIVRTSASLLPPSLLAMFSGIDENEFRADISSSEIRRRSMTETK